VGAFLAHVVNRAKIASVISTHAHAKCDFKEKKTKF